MVRMTCVRLAVAAAALTLLTNHAALSGQTPSAQAPAAAEGTGPAVVGAGSFSPIIASLQKTM